MRTITLSVASGDDVSARALAAFSGAPQGEHLSFASASLLWEMMTAERWAILEHLAGRARLAPAEIADRVSRETDAVSVDVEALIGLGLLEPGGNGTFTCPFDKVHVDFVLTRAA